MDLKFIRAQRMKVGKKYAFQMGLINKKDIKKQSVTAKSRALETDREENKNDGRRRTGQKE